MYSFNFKVIIDELINNFSAGANIFTVAVIFISVFYLIVIGIIFALFFLRAIGVYKMSLSSGFKNPWYSFIPFLNSYALGRIAENYEKRNKTKSAKFSIILMVLHISTFVFEIITLLVSFAAMMNTFINLANNYNRGIDVSVQDFFALIPLAFVSLIFIGVALAYKIVYFICYWRVASVFDFKNATLYTVLSILLNFLDPVFLFVIRNKKPCFKYDERMGQFVNKY